MDKPLKSVTRGQCDARPTVTFPAAGHHRPLTGMKLFCLVTEAHVCEQLAQGCYLRLKALPVSTTLLLPTLLSDSQVSISLVVHGL